MSPEVLPTNPAETHSKRALESPLLPMKRRVKRKPLLVQVDEKRKFGYLKFFHYKKRYGFISSNDGKEYFCHFDDMKSSGISSADVKNIIKERRLVSFSCLSYFGKHNFSQKAVNLKLM